MLLNVVKITKLASPPLFKNDRMIVGSVVPPVSLSTNKGMLRGKNGIRRA